MSGEQENTRSLDLEALPRAQVSTESKTPQLPERYRPEGVAGRGGMASVYRAYDTELGRTVAVKILSAEYSGSDHALERFRREARVLAALRHPGIVDIYDVRPLASGHPCLVMEWMEGGSLREKVDRHGPLPEAEVRPIALQISAALAAAQAKGVIHRDIKPHNLLLDAEGVPHLSDFGVARNTTDTASSTTGHVVGTLAYMAPEQLQGRPTMASDVYGLGLTLIFLLTGDRDPAGLDTQIDSAFAKLLRECTRLDQHKRIADAEQLLQRLKELPSKKARASYQRWGVALLLVLGLITTAFAVGRPKAGEDPVAASKLQQAAPTQLNDRQAAGADPLPPIASNSSPQGIDEPDPSSDAIDEPNLTEAIKTQVSAPKPTIKAEIPPRLEHNPPGQAALGRAIPIRAELDAGLINKAMIHFNRGGDWSSKKMAVDGKTASGSILAKQKGTVNYWIEVHDERGKRYTFASENKPQSIEIR